MLRLLVVPLAITALAATPAGAGQRVQEEPPLPPEYVGALARLQRGDADGALVAFRAVPEELLPTITKTLMQRPRDEDHRIWISRTEAAVLLHSEAYLARLREGVLEPADPNLASARALARALLAPGRRWVPESTQAARRFSLQWYLMMVAAWHGHGMVGRSRAYLAEARDTFPGDPDVLNASGADREILFGLLTGPTRETDLLGHVGPGALLDRDRELRAAQRFFEGALEADATHIEARLRLGHVLYRRGELADADRHLDEVARHTGTLEMQYLALVLRGLVQTDRGQFALADRLFGEALTLLPNTQSAVLGRSLAAYLDGRAVASAAWMTSLLQEPTTGDPWWFYVRGQWWHYRARIGTLRAHVRGSVH